MLFCYSNERKPAVPANMDLSAAAFTLICLMAIATGTCGTATDNKHPPQHNQQQQNQQQKSGRGRGSMWWYVFDFGPIALCGNDDWHLANRDITNRFWCPLKSARLISVHDACALLSYYIRAAFVCDIHAAKLCRIKTHVDSLHVYFVVYSI